jgi:hypothetical protein
LKLSGTTTFDFVLPIIMLVVIAVAVAVAAVSVSSLILYFLARKENICI